ncbi:MAG: RNA methyltransferase [Bacteroidales bacterium]|jgi:TrmH family RNA methyltransferase|nr:RNA methyltransferase [Bacteroidales bacterium]
MNFISSCQNSNIKEISNFLNKPTLQKKAGIVIIEGLKEISIAITAKVEILKIFFCPEIISYFELEKIIGEQIVECEICEITKNVFSKIAFRETTGGVVALGKRPEKKLEEMKISEDSVFIILDAVEKPGNLGAICRVADAANVSGIIITDLHTDIYNANAIRASLGCVFSLDVVCADFNETLEWLKKNKIKSFAAELKNSNYYYETDMTGKIAFVFGTEATGLPEKWIKNSDTGIKIPMLGIIDSLNVNTSVAIIIFEAMKQRKFIKKGGKNE